MRLISPKEKKQRGCIYCADLYVMRGNRRFNNASRHFCPYDICPYHELDQTESYEQYMRKVEESNEGIVDALMNVLDPTHKKQVL